MFQLLVWYDCLGHSVHCLVYASVSSITSKLWFHVCFLYNALFGFWICEVLTFLPISPDTLLCLPLLWGQFVLTPLRPVSLQAGFTGVRCRSSWLMCVGWLLLLLPFLKFVLGTSGAPFWCSMTLCPVPWNPEWCQEVAHWYLSYPTSFLHWLSHPPALKGCGISEEKPHPWVPCFVHVSCALLW